MNVRRVLFVSPVLVVAALVIAGARNVERGVALGALVLGAAFVGPRVRMTPESQNVVAGVTLLPATLLVLLFPTEDPHRARLDGVLGILAVWSVLACTSRLVMLDPAWGGRALLAFGTLGAALVGYADLGSLYRGLAWTFVFTALAALWASDENRPRIASLPRRVWVVGTALVLVTLGASTLSAWGLPKLHDWVVERYFRTQQDSAPSGFSPWLELGTVRSITLSEEVVLRVDGPAPAYLRGTAYDVYERGRWRTAHNVTLDTVPLARGPLMGADVTRVERLGGLAGWYFVPPDAGEIATRNGSVRRDAVGSLRGVLGDPTREVWFRRNGAPSPVAPFPPTPTDRAVPLYLRPTLAALAARWTEGTRTDAERMDALRRHLRTHYRYALRFARAPHLDPVMDFLTLHREGHCEYFASALALLGRVVGVPTRVVGGYRVAERHPYANHHVVREKNAHAWVEAWVDGRWRLYDATPAGAIPYNEPHQGSRWRAIVDLLRLRFESLRTWALGEGVLPLSLTATALLLAWISWRVWLRRNPTDGPTVSVDVGDHALPCLRTLDAALATMGLARAPGETLERHATRIEASTLPLRTEVADVIRRYAALRYGAVGDEDTLAQAVLRTARAVEETALKAGLQAPKHHGP